LDEIINLKIPLSQICILKNQIFLIWKLFHNIWNTCKYIWNKSENGIFFMKFWKNFFRVFMIEWIKKNIFWTFLKIFKLVNAIWKKIKPMIRNN
jgi:hypothetical protein